MAEDFARFFGDLSPLLKQRLIHDVWENVQEYMRYNPGARVIAVTYTIYTGITELLRINKRAVAVRVHVDYSNLQARGYRYTYLPQIQRVMREGDDRVIIERYFDCWHRTLHMPIAFGLPASRYRVYHSTPLREELEQ